MKNGQNNKYLWILPPIVLLPLILSETSVGKKTFIFPKKKFWLTAACLQVYQHFLAFERLVTYPYSVRELIRALNPHGQAGIAHNSCHLPLSLH